MRSFMYMCRQVQGARFIQITRSRCGRTIPYKLADIGEGIKEVEVVTLYVKPGDRIGEFEKICEVQSDKATVEITSRYAGVITTVHIEAGEKAHVGEPIVDIEVNDTDETQKPSCGTVDCNVSDQFNSGGVPVAEGGDSCAADCTTEISKDFTKVLATPAVREFARSRGVNITDVKGTGKDGRVLREDVLSYAGKSCYNDDVVVRLDTGLRKAMVSSMTKAGSVPSFTACDEVEVSQLLNFQQILRDALNSSSEGVRDGSKVSLMPLFIKAASQSLLQYPELNAHVSSECDKLFVKKAHHIGFAMDTPKGLVVPVVRDVQQKSVAELVHEVNELVTLGRKSQIPPDRMKDGTFTLSNIGPIGAIYATPMLNPPQVAIGAIGRIQQLPRFDASGNVVRANILAMSWTADHRVIDGATLVRFSNAFKRCLESPGLLIAGEVA
ncbi:dihydrolipoamide branched chain transacylase [Trypanosoma brucei equiperdum]|uniref:Dihydrolipoamide acetyltransferase component of pyruvate dehydrogenase complex n=1 Tax=Trypanosoma brucei equiperdum TaxID=630700 RepID=A0A3L6L8J6_9TRYP|nr:dihydrolipoamide branched chain transacylase [Trypanosoma brucei equiperdum]